MCALLTPLLFPKTAHITALVPNRKSSRNERATRKMHQMSFCKAFKLPLASFRLLTRSCPVIRRLCGETESWACDLWKLPAPGFIYLYYIAYSWGSTYAVSAVIDYSWKTWCILEQILPQSLLLIHCLHALKRISISKPEAPFKMIIDDKEWMIS